jgi:hypothetical protein
MAPLRIQRFGKIVTTLVLVLGSAVLAYESQERKKPAPKDTPHIVVAQPLGILPGTAAKLTLRGLKLDVITEIRCQEPKATAKLIGKGKKVGVPAQMDAGRVGDTEAQIEISLPKEQAGATVTITVLSPAGESEPYKLLVDRVAAIAEKEPNNGFRQAQSVKLPQEIDGSIATTQDVDMFRFDGKKGQQIVCEVFAARHGSALDSLLTLYDATGAILASNDDLDGNTTDSRIELTLPKDGVYYVGLIDAQDVGGPAHIYRLSIRLK